MKNWLLWLSLLFLHAPLVFAGAGEVIIPKSASHDINHEDYYFSELLKLVLHKTEAEFGKVALIEPANWKADKRLKSELYNKNIDLLWSPTSKELEDEFIPIRISLLKDLNDYRVFLIRPEMQPAFSKVKTLHDLRKLKGGINPQWPDAEVMDQNELPLVKAVGYGKLFKMLAAGRFDYYSRGIYQVDTDVNFYPELHLAIEKELLLHYKNEVYFFVRKDSPQLAKRLTRGLELAIKDGSFDELFNKIPRYRWALDTLSRHQRRTIELTTNEQN